jgi:hypothetical protein
MYNLIRDWVPAGESRTYAYADGVQTVLCMSGAMVDLPEGRSVVLIPEQTVTLTAAEDSMLTVFKRPAVDLPSPLHAHATLTEGEWQLNDVDAKNIFLRHNNEQYEKATLLFTGDYPKLEKDTWPTQRDEVHAWIANPLYAPTPWVDQAASTRNVDREEFLRRTLAKSIQFSRVSAFLTGARQRYEDIIDSGIAPDLDYTVPDTLYMELQEQAIFIMTSPIDQLKYYRGR